MLKNYFVTSFRNILRDGYYSVLKIAGLALGIGTTLLLFLFIAHQVSYDKDHPDVDRLFRVNQTHIWRPGGGLFHSTGPAVAAAMREEFPEVEATLRINTPGAYAVRYVSPDGTSKVIDDNYSNIFAADSNFFDFFNFPLAQGDPATALQGANKVILSDKAAYRLFGDEPALGKLIRLEKNRETSQLTDSAEVILVEVTGVTKEQPKNVHFTFDYLLSMETNRNVRFFEWSWVWTQVVTYVKLASNADVGAMEARLNEFGDRHAVATFERIGMDYKEFLKEKGHWHLYLQPVQDIHLYSGSSSDRFAIGNRLGSTGDIRYVYMMGGIAGFILLIAIINFVNISTARAANRSKEVGIKKSLGVQRKSIMMQFQVENVIITSIATLIGLAVMELLRLLVLQYGIEIPLPDWNAVFVFCGLVLFVCLISFLAGIYPSLYLSSFKPGEILKGRLATGFSSSPVRNALVVFQFIISIALMSGTWIVYEQLQFFLSADLGFHKENLMIIENVERLGPKATSLRNELAQMKDVEHASEASDFRIGSEDIFMPEGSNKQVTLAQYKVDPHFLGTIGLTLVGGKNFGEGEDETNANGVLINETAVRALGWTIEEAVGRKIVYNDGNIGAREVIGVVKDFYFQSLIQSVAPTIFYSINSPIWGSSRVIALRYNTTEVTQLLDAIHARWERMADGSPFLYTFYEEGYKAEYEREQQIGLLLTLFTALSIIIAVMGLSGLVAYAAEQRRREIGVRKVFGASVTSIYVLINRQYLLLLAIALLIATPVTWILMQEWLNGYTKRITISPVVFLTAGIAEMLIALGCVAFVSLKAATVNPAVVLKSE